MAGHNVNVCDIGDKVKETLKKFRFRKHTSNCALILKVNREKQELEVDEELEDVQLEELQDILPSHQPRFVAYSYKMEHSDGRTSFPLCFIYYTPRDAHMELQVMYAGTQRALAKEIGGKMLEVREIDELTEEWLNEKLRSYKMEHSDGRTSFPLCFIYYTPRDAHMELQVMYAGTQRALAKEIGGKMLEVREIDELTEEWLNEKLRR